MAASETTATAGSETGRAPWQGTEKTTGGTPPALADQNQLILSYLPLVKSMAARVYGSLPRAGLVEMNDLVQAGLVGLTHAARNYRPRMEVSFSLYARYRVRGEILDTLRRLDLASRDLRRWQKQAAAATHELTGKLQRPPTDEELAESLQEDVASVREKRAALLMAARVAPGAREAEDGELPEPDVAADPESRPDAVYCRGEARGLLDRALSSLPERHREVIALYYSRELSMKEIGHRLQVNESRVSQIHKGALAGMAKALRSSGVYSSADV
ncbi:MAG: sigma-70 family RNA polymerase sigma factor [Acidobacteria bacterium]|nr:sigma-70 family RNA polymerase sigma factor [Acidobacteriota bacterium]